MHELSHILDSEFQKITQDVLQCLLEGTNGNGIIKLTYVYMNIVLAWIGVTASVNCELGNVGWLQTSPEGLLSNDWDHSCKTQCNSLSTLALLMSLAIMNLLCSSSWGSCINCEIWIIWMWTAFCIRPFFESAPTSGGVYAAGGTYAVFKHEYTAVSLLRDLQWLELQQSPGLSSSGPTQKYQLMDTGPLLNTRLSFIGDVIQVMPDLYATSRGLQGISSPSPTMLFHCN